MGPASNECERDDPLGDGQDFTHGKRKRASAGGNPSAKLIRLQNPTPGYAELPRQFESSLQHHTLLWISRADVRPLFSHVLVDNIWDERELDGLHCVAFPKYGDNVYLFIRVGYSKLADRVPKGDEDMLNFFLRPKLRRWAKAVSFCAGESDDVVVRIEFERDAGIQGLAAYIESGDKILATSWRRQSH